MTRTNHAQGQARSAGLGRFDAAAIVLLQVRRHPGRQVLVSRKVVAAVGRAAAKPAIRWALQSNIQLM
jgi:hypothetical protein